MGVSKYIVKTNAKNTRTLLTALFNNLCNKYDYYTHSEAMLIKAKNTETIKYKSSRLIDGFSQEIFTTGEEMEITKVNEILTKHLNSSMTIHSPEGESVGTTTFNKELFLQIMKDIETEVEFDVVEGEELLFVSVSNSTTKHIEQIKQITDAAGNTEQVHLYRIPNSREEFDRYFIEEENVSGLDDTDFKMLRTASPKKFEGKIVKSEAKEMDSNADIANFFDIYKGLYSILKGKVRLRKRDFGYLAMHTSISSNYQYAENFLEFDEGQIGIGNFTISTPSPLNIGDEFVMKAFITTEGEVMIQTLESEDARAYKEMREEARMYANLEEKFNSNNYNFKSYIIK